MADPKKKQKKGPKKRVANNKIEIARLRRIEIEKAKEVFLNIKAFLLIKGEVSGTHKPSKTVSIFT